MAARDALPCRVQLGPWELTLVPANRPGDPPHVEGSAWEVSALGRYLFARKRSGEPSLQEYLGPEGSALLERLSAAAPALLFEARMEIPANWKLVISGAIEDYHVPVVHGSSVNPWRTVPAPPQLRPGGHSSYQTPAPLGRVARALHACVAGRTPVEPIFANHLLFPNLLTIQLWGLVHVTRFQPLSRDRTERVTRVYTPPKPPLWSPLRWTRALLARPLRAAMGITFREDREICIEAQAGTAVSCERERGPAHEEEARVEHLLDTCAERLALQRSG